MTSTTYVLLVVMIFVLWMPGAPSVYIGPQTWLLGPVNTNCIYNGDVLLAPAAVTPGLLH